MNFDFPDSAGLNKDLIKLLLPHSIHSNAKTIMENLEPAAWQMNSFLLYVFQPRNRQANSLIDGSVQLDLLHRDELTSQFKAHLPPAAPNYYQQAEEPYKLPYGTLRRSEILN